MKFKTTSFCTTKEMVTNWRGCPENGRKCFPAIHLIRD
jgi:hypothetical protein